jgi:micrococcal nuclease
MCGLPDGAILEPRRRPICDSSPTRPGLSGFCRIGRFSKDGALLRYKVGFVALVVLTLLVIGGLIVVVNGLDVSGPMSSPSSRSPERTAAPSASSSERHDDRYAAVPRPPHGIPAAAELAVVSDHVDGDTLHLQAGERSKYLVPGAETTVRLLEIDTPESVDPGSPEQCYSHRASAQLRRLAPLGATLWVKPDQELLDRYGRTLLYLWSGDGTFINHEMVRLGEAKAALYAPNDEYISLMRSAERQARAQGRGLWGACDYFGQPIGLAHMRSASPAPSREGPASPATGLHEDPRFPYCSDANAAGYGNYVRGRDPEYGWYDDRDGDGVVCES